MHYSLYGFLIPFSLPGPRYHYVKWKIYAHMGSRHLSNNCSFLQVYRPADSIIGIEDYNDDTSIAVGKNLRHFFSKKPVFNPQYKLCMLSLRQYTGQDGSIYWGAYHKISTLHNKISILHRIRRRSRRFIDVNETPGLTPIGNSIYFYV